jgi:N6-adenosine-specific RNA methylase IME4
MGRRTAESHYRTLSVDDLASLPVPMICAPDCVLFLWVPSSLLEDGLRLMTAWGFYFKTVAFVWVKRTKNGLHFWGMGHWTRTGAEVCLMGIRGSPKRVAKNVHQVIEAEVRQYSRKPDETRERIERLMGDVPRIELFARDVPSGWTAWGDETHRFVPR